MALSERHDFNSSARANQLPKEVLLIEHNLGDARLAREAFRAPPGAVAESIHLYEAPDGATALAYLRRQGPYTRAPRPDIILLDLNLPRMSGLELLAQIKQDADLKVIPVIVLSSSDAGGCGEQLPAGRELLFQKTQRMGRIRQHREGHQGFLAQHGQPAGQRVEPRARPCEGA